MGSLSIHFTSVVVAIYFMFWIPLSKSYAFNRKNNIYCSVQIFNDFLGVVFIWIQSTFQQFNLLDQISRSKLFKCLMQVPCAWTEVVYTEFVVEGSLSVMLFITELWSKWSKDNGRQKNMRFLNPKAEFKRRHKLNKFLPSRFYVTGIWVVSVSSTLVQDYASGRRHLPLHTFTKYTPSPSPSIDVQWR